MVAGRSAFPTTVPLALVVLVLLALLLPGISRSQQVAIPDTAVGRVFSAWLDAFNSADRDKLAEFDKQYDGRNPGAVEALIGFRSQTGGFDIVSIGKSEPLYIEYVVKERASDRHAAGMLHISSADAPRITASVLRAIAGDGSAMNFSVDAATRERVITGAIDKLNEHYVFPETAKKMAQVLRKRQKAGDYDEVTNGESFAQLLTTHLQEVSGDKHLRVNFSPAAMPPPAPPSEQQTAQMRRSMERANCGFEKVERLAGNVGYVKFNQFAPPDLCRDTASAAMGFLSNVDAIIFDLRDNGGGMPAMVAYVSSYLFDKRTHLNDLWTRKGGTTEEFWTLEELPGKRMPNVPAFVLTSSRTFSGAEEFTYNLKNLKRAAIVGETTGGGAHPTRGERIDERFMIGVPFARAINPISKTNWEGTGVEPDVKVPAADALAEAQKLAAEKIAALARAPSAAAK